MRDEYILESVHAYEHFCERYGYDVSAPESRKVFDKYVEDGEAWDKEIREAMEKWKMQNEIIR